MERIVEKALRPFTVVWRALALTLVICATGGAWADFQKTNPVTGETENYTWKFVGTDTWNGTENWQDSSSANPSGTPAKSGENTWDPILFDGNTISINASMSVEGWNLRMGLYNGANVTMNNFVKYQGDTTMWMTVDETSQLTVGGFSGGNITDNQVIKLSVAKANGITWTANLTSGNANNTFEYYLKGAGSVSYQAVSAANHKIKMADVTLSGNEKSVQSKTLVSFTSSTPTFTADATIKRLNSSGTDLDNDAHVATVTTGSTTLTTDNDVGTCELVQTSTGIVLYYVDGDPANLPAATVYKPSININFTSGTALSTGADVGIGDYAVPGTSWNNLIGNNGSLATVTGVDDAGVTSTINGAKVTISGTRGYYYNGNVQAASDLRQGYIDDNGNNPSPQFVVEGIPYYSYKTILYFSSDNNETKFGYVTVNGANYKGDLDNTATVTSEGGSDIWGSASVSAFTEGGNYLVIPTQINTDGKLTVVSHRLSGSRAGLAAVQIIEVKPDVGENDLEIAVDGDTNYTVSEGKTLSGTVYLTGSGTLTLSGDYKIEAGTIEVSPAVTLNANTARLDADTYIGAGTVAYDNALPATGKGWTESTWTGTVWIKNKTIAAFEGNDYGNAGSTIRFTGVTGYLQTNTYNSKGYVHTVPLELVDDGNTVAFTYNNGWGGNLVKINTLKGTGTLKTQDSGLGEHIYIVDGSGFTGVFNLTGKYVYVGGSQPDYSASTNPNGKLEIRSGVTMTVPADKTWTANGGFVVNGTLNVDGTLASSHTTKAVSGAGTVVFTGRAPTVSGDAWWKNADWTGTVQVKDVTNMVGDSRTGVWLKFNDYGNSGSVVEMNNVTGWLETGYTCTVPLKVTGSLYLNNGGSGKSSAFKVGTLLGSGTISGDGSATTVVFNITDDWSGFTGTFGLNNKCIVFGETIPDELTAGTIYVSEGAVVTPQQSSSTWWAVGGIKVDGELRAPNLDKFGGGTTITTSDTGVFTLITNSNADDMNTDYARLQGTGTLRLEGSAYRCISTNNFPTAMSVDNRLTAGLLHRIPGLEITIGSLAGDGYLRSDWGGSAGDRDLKVLQAKDTTWSGKFWTSNPHRFRSLIVAPGATTAGTLTLSATHESAESTGLAVQSGAKVNLTGTWVGATTVAGTFGGTGTLTGNLTFSNGATFKAYTTGDADGLSVSGTITYPEEGTVTVDVSAIEPAADVALLKADDLNATKFSLSGAPEGSSLEVVDGVLTLKVPTTVDITITAVANATASVTVNGDPVTPVEGVITVNVGDEVVVTYTANDGYVVSGSPVAFTATAESTAVDTSSVTSVAVVARITDTEGTYLYTDLATAFDEVDDGDTLTLVGTAVTIASDVTVETSFTLAGDSQGTAITGAGKIYLTGSVELVLDATIASVGNQFWFSSKNAVLTFPTGKSFNVRPYTAGGCQTGSRDNGDGTSSYYQYLYLRLTVGASNVSLVYDGSGESVVTKQVYEGDVIVFTAIPASGYENVVVTINSEEQTPVNGKYSVTIGTANVTISATASAMPIITVPSIENTTVTVTANGSLVDGNNGEYAVPSGSEVIVTYAPVSGYALSGTSTYNIASATENVTITITDTTVAQYVAKIVDGASYTSLQAVFDAVANNNKIVLLASTEDGATIPSRAMQFYFYAGDFECGAIADATGDFVTTKTDANIEIDEVEVAAKKYRVAAAVAVVTIPAEGSTNYGDYMTAYTAFLNGPAGTTMRVIGTNPFASDLPCTSYDSETQTYTKLTAVASITTGVMTVDYPSLADAVAAATAGQTVKLLTNVALDAPVAISITLTLDLNGYAITASGINAITTSGALTIQGSSGSITVTTGNSVVLTDRAATATVSGITLSPVPTTTVGGGARIIGTTSAGVTTYRVGYGTIFSVY